MLEKPTVSYDTDSDALADLLDRTIPVSYTHLDVYKRQAYAYPQVTGV